MNEIAAILDGLRQVPTILTAFVRSIPPEARIRQRGQGAWTIAGHVAHLAKGQPMLLERLQRILNEDEPEFIPYFPSETEAEAEALAIDVDEALEAFAAGRAKQMEILDFLPAEAWDRMARHPEYERYGLRILARHILMHDHWHMYRMEELWLTRNEYLPRLDG